MWDDLKPKTHLVWASDKQYMLNISNIALFWWIVSYMEAHLQKKPHRNVSDMILF